MTFEPEAVEAMGHAYEALLDDLGLVDRNDPFTEIVAKEIVKVASRGARNPTEIRAAVLAALRSQPRSEARCASMRS